MKDAETLPQS